MATNGNSEDPRRSRRFVVLLIELDERVIDLVRETLAHHGIAVRVEHRFARALRAAHDPAVDLVIVDLRLEDGDGLDLLRRIRAKSDVPVIVLSADSEEADRVLALDNGADDFVAKPFGPLELVARVRAIGRRRAPASTTEPIGRADVTRIYRFAGWELNVPRRRLLDPHGTIVNLTITEFNLLSCFLRSPQRVLSREVLMASSRLHDDLYERSINVQVLRLRRKLTQGSNPQRLLKTVRHAGYVLDTPVEAIK